MPRSPRQVRFASWSAVLAITIADAAIATPLGFTLLYFAVVAVAAFSLRRSEVIALACVAALSRVLFGPIGDPLGIDSFAVTVSPEVQSWIGAGTSFFAYVATGVLLFTMARQRRDLRSLRADVETDPLTGVGNRRALNEFLSRHDSTFGAAIAVDLDHFKRVNDEHGHGVGDEVLVELAARISRAVRIGDLVARTGGEEFVFLLPGAPAEVAVRIGQGIRDLVRETRFQAGGIDLSLTVSVGVASGPIGESILAAADAALYEAKHGGRDCVRTASTSTARDRLPISSTGPDANVRGVVH